MAIYHLNVKIIGRSSGRSSVAAAAYRAGEKLHNERDGVTHDYTRKSGVIYSEILLPDDAPSEFQDRAILWNAVEKSEKRIDAQTAREVEIALPVEFDIQQQIELMRDYINKNFVSAGMCADFAIHDKEDGNPHAHILLTTRIVAENGFEGKNRDWNKPARLEKWRENWAAVCNERLSQEKHIDHRTLEAQGVDREPTIHEGRNPKRIQENREIIRRNETRTPEYTAQYLQELKECYVILDKEISAIKQEQAQTYREIRDISFRVENIEEQSANINKLQTQLDALKTTRQSMGFFKSKKEIDGQIQGLEKSAEQARQFFRRSFGVEPHEAFVSIERLTAQLNELRQRPTPDISPLLETQKTIEQEYVRQWREAEQNPDVQEMFERLKKNNEPKSIRERLKYAETERKFNRMIKGDEIKTITRERD